MNNRMYHTGYNDANSYKSMHTLPSGFGDRLTILLAYVS